MKLYYELEKNYAKISARKLNVCDCLWSFLKELWIEDTFQLIEP